jgi:hypothetical protein
MQESGVCKSMGGGGVAVDPYVEILAPLQSGECNILGRIMFCNDHVL